MEQHRTVALSEKIHASVWCRAILLGLVFELTAPNVSSAPKAELWEKWATHDLSSRVTIDHSAWALFLNTYLRASPDGINRIPYGNVIDADKRRLANYVATLETIPISRYHRNEQLAYWINLYNAATIKLVLDHYPIQSIFDIKISPGLFSAGPWGKKFLEVEREKLSLDDIEHRILRPVWQDPRIHYAVNCASVGCPNLMDEPFTAANSETLLTVAARDYINHERGVMLRGGRLVVSRIYEWYKEDFDGSDEGVIRHLRQFAKLDLASALASVNRISDYRYDWALNDAGRASDPQRRTASGKSGPESKD